LSLTFIFSFAWHQASRQAVSSNNDNTGNCTTTRAQQINLKYFTFVLFSISKEAFRDQGSEVKLLCAKRLKFLERFFGC